MPVERSEVVVAKNSCAINNALHDMKRPPLEHRSPSCSYLSNGHYQHQHHKAAVEESEVSNQNLSNRRSAKQNTGSSLKNGKSKRSPCIRFWTKGDCGYGDSCKFSHEASHLPSYHSYELLMRGHVSNRVSPISDPRIGNVFRPVRPMHASMPTDQFRSPPRVDRESHIPPLPLFSREWLAQCAQVPVSSCNQNLQRTSPTASPAKRLRFKDAVLKQKSGMSFQSKWKSGTRANSNQDEIVEEEETRRECCISPDIDGVSTRQRKTGRSYPTNCSNSNVMLGPTADSGAACSKHLLSDHDNNFHHRTNYRHQGTPSESMLASKQPYQQYQHTLEPYSMYASQLVRHFYPSYTQFPPEIIHYNSLSRQVEIRIERLDSETSALEVCQQQAVDSLQTLARGIWSDAIIDVYGSNYTRLALPESDVDCVLVAKTLVDVHPLSILQKLAAVLEQQSWAKSVELLSSAKIPVLKVVYGGQKRNVMLDLTCGHSVGHSGLNARDLIYSFQAEMPALRPLVMVLKCHLQRNGLNCAFTGGLSSYALVLLVIRFLQACGDEHYKSFNSDSRQQDSTCCRSNLDEAALPHEHLKYTMRSLELENHSIQPQWMYCFSREGKVTWRTGIGNLLLLFLETYITFDYRRFGVSIENGGEYFMLPPDKMITDAAAVVTPYISDPIKPDRNIGNCFRLHEVIQAWFMLYQQLAHGVPLELALAPTVHA